MGPKKGHADEFLNVISQEEWEVLLQKDGMLVLDVFQDWSGPCRAVNGLFKRLQDELDAAIITFATAQCTTIDSLDKYRGKSEPCFLIYGGGILIAAVRGINPPELERVIRDKYKQEEDVLRGEAQRIEIQDPFITAIEEAKATAARLKEMEQEVPLESEIIVLKPELISSGKNTEIINELIENRFEIIKRITKPLIDSEARTIFSSESSDITYEKKILVYITTPCDILLITKGNEGVVAEINEYMDATKIIDDIEVLGLRARIEAAGFTNGIYVSKSIEDAVRDQVMLFPDYEPPIVTIYREKGIDDKSEAESGKIDAFHNPDLDMPPYNGPQRTVALIRPSALKFHKNEILNKIIKANYTILMQNEFKFSEEDAKLYYAHRIDEPDYKFLIKEMTSGPSLALLLAQKDSINQWKNLLGPKSVERAIQEFPQSLRALFSTINENGDISKVNLLHGSMNEAEVQSDMLQFFPVETTFAIIKPDAYANRDEILERIKSEGFKIVAKKELEISQESVDKIYPKAIDKPYYTSLIKLFSSGPSVFLVLRKQLAIKDWRSLMGNTDPDKDVDEYPDFFNPDKVCLRGIYGRNTLQNAVHGCSFKYIENLLEEFFSDCADVNDLRKKKSSESASTDEKTVNSEKAKDEKTANSQGAIDEKTVNSEKANDEKTANSQIAIDEKTVNSEKANDEKTANSQGAIDEKTANSQGAIDEKTANSQGAIDEKTANSQGAIDDDSPKSDLTKGEKNTKSEATKDTTGIKSDEITDINKTPPDVQSKINENNTMIGEDSKEIKEDTIEESKNPIL